MPRREALQKRKRLLSDFPSLFPLGKQRRHEGHETSKVGFSLIYAHALRMNRIQLKSGKTEEG